MTLAESRYKRQEIRRLCTKRAKYIYKRTVPERQGWSHSAVCLSEHVGHARPLMHRSPPGARGGSLYTRVKQASLHSCDILCPRER
ncbi:hypothetical protein QQF64_019036 [Cirrhinus molitorella]|uniref:Uncharacterized protein n=1 Tax=Cirrhinus molitorella TaxID=172907 RepID=A0ABR3LEE7_9TELE